MIESKCFFITENEVSEEIKKLRLVERVFNGLGVDDGGYLFDNLDNFCLIIEHILVIVVDFLHEINAAEVFLNMVSNFPEMRDEFELNVLIVLNKTHQELVAQMQ